MTCSHAGRPSPSTGVPGDDWPAYRRPTGGEGVRRRPALEYDPHASRVRPGRVLRWPAAESVAVLVKCCASRRACGRAIPWVPPDRCGGDEFTAVASILQREHGVGVGAESATSDLGWRYASTSAHH